MTQIDLVLISPNESKVFIRQNNFFAGIINSELRIFYHIPRSQKNVFKLFGFEGLGINEEILLMKSLIKLWSSLMTRLLLQHA